MDNILIMKEGAPYFGTHAFEGLSLPQGNKDNFIMAQILSKLGKNVGVLIPGQQGSVPFENNGFTCLTYQELYAEFKEGNVEPRISMAKTKDILKKSDVAIFSPRHFDTSMERSLLYSYLRTIETVVLLDDTSALSDIDLVEFADYIIATEDFKSVEGRKATVIIDRQERVITGMHNGFNLLTIGIPKTVPCTEKSMRMGGDNPAEHKGGFISAFTAGFVFGISTGATISASMKIGVAMADVAHQSDDGIPSECDTTYLCQNYKEIVARL